MGLSLRASSVELAKRPHGSGIAVPAVLNSEYFWV